MKPSVYMEEMDAFTYRDKLEGDSIFFIPVGALEQHGSHMAMCVDAALTKTMAGHLTGTTSLRGTTLIALARDIAYSLIRQGARKIVLMNGHYENYQFAFEGMQLAIEDARREGIDDVKIQLLSYWDFVDDATIERLYPDGFTGWDLEHAGVMETSLMLLFFPDLVDMSRMDEKLYTGLPATLPNYDVLPIVPSYTPPSGCLSHPGESSKEKGIILRDVAVANMVEAIKLEYL